MLFKTPFEKHNNYAFQNAYTCSFIHSLPWNMRLHCFLLLIARLMRLAIILPAEVSRKSDEIKDFSQNYVVSLCGVVVRCSRVEPKVLGSRPTEFFFSFLFFPVVFYKYIAK